MDSIGDMYSISCMDLMRGRSRSKTIDSRGGGDNISVPGISTIVCSLSCFFILMLAEMCYKDYIGQAIA